MKIFIVCSRLCYGGAERVGALLANGFVMKGHDVTVVSNLFVEQTFELKDTVRLLNLVSTNKNRILKWMGSFILMRRYIKHYQPDVVIGIANTCSFVAKVSGIGMGVPVIMTEHDAFERPASAPFSFWKHFAKFRLNKIYKFVTVLTDVDKQVIDGRLKHIDVMPNPLAITPVTSVPAKQNIILAVGRLDDWHCKGFDVLMKAWGKTVDRLRDKVERERWKLLIAGEPGEGKESKAAYIHQLCHDLNMQDTVNFIGFQQNIKLLYQDANIFVLSSRYEGFGLVLIEAMSQGCACIACDYKGRQREILQNDSQGLICEPDDVDALADALEKMISDEEYQESVRKNAIERSKYYSIDNTMDRWEKLLSQIVKN